MKSATVISDREVAKHRTVSKLIAKLHRMLNGAGRRAKAKPRKKKATPVAEAPRPAKKGGKKYDAAAAAE